MEMDYGGGDVFSIMDFSMEPPGFKLFRLDGRTGESFSVAAWAMPLPDPPYRVVKSDDLGHIIVHAYSEMAADPSRKAASHFDIFDQDGRYLASFSYPFKSLIEKPML
jgi:hypothetical protein